MPQYDVIVVGLGVTGTATLAELARRGVRALGIERHAVGHDLGSSHGETRMIRLGYFEHPSYVPLLRRTYELWRGLEAATNTRLLHVTGIAEMGLPESDIVAGHARGFAAARAAARGPGCGGGDAAVSGVSPAARFRLRGPAGRRLCRG